MIHEELINSLNPAQRQYAVQGLILLAESGLFQLANEEGLKQIANQFSVNTDAQVMQRIGEHRALIVLLQTLQALGDQYKEIENASS